MSESPKLSSKLQLLIQGLQKLLSMDNFLAKSLLAVIRRLEKQRFLFVIGIGMLVLAALIVVYLVDPTVAGPFYAALAVFLILALWAMGDLVFRALPPDIASEKPQTRTQRKGNVMPDIPQNCASIRRQLEEAQKTLDILEQQAAATPFLESDVKLIRKLNAHRLLVAELIKKLNECIAKEEKP